MPIAITKPFVDGIGNVINGLIRGSLAIPSILLAGMTRSFTPATSTRAETRLRLEHSDFSFSSQKKPGRFTPRPNFMTSRPAGNPPFPIKSQSI